MALIIRYYRLLPAALWALNLLSVVSLIMIDIFQLGALPTVAVIIIHGLLALFIVRPRD